MECCSCPFAPVLAELRAEDFRAIAELVEMISPVLHHAHALIPIFAARIGAAPHRRVEVGELLLYGVGVQMDSTWKNRPLKSDFYLEFDFSGAPNPCPHPSIPATVRVPLGRDAVGIDRAIASSDECHKPEAA